MDKEIMLTTSRLIIYSPSSQDFNELYQLQSNPEVMRFIGNGIRTEEDVLQGLEKAIGHQKKHGFSLGSVFKKEGLEFVGRAGLIYQNYDDSQPEIEVAYALLPKYWKQGYAVELALNLINWAHTSLFISNILPWRLKVNSYHAAYFTSFFGNDPKELIAY